MATLSQRLSGRQFTRRPQPKVPYPFGEFLPDQPRFNNPGLITAKNAIPHHRSYKSFPSLNALGTALTLRCQGAVSYTDDADAEQIYAGDKNDLYQWSGVNPANVSQSAGGYTVADDHMWQFARFGNKVIAVNIADAMQSMTMGGSNFADMATSTLKPKAKYIAVVRDRFVMIGNLNESGAQPRRVRWSAIDDEADWDQSATTLSDFQDLRDKGGQVTGIAGGEIAIVFQEHAIVRGTFVGSPEVFAFETLEYDYGAWAPHSIVPLGRVAYFLSEQGFHVTDGYTSRPIGDGKVDETFLSRLDFSARHRVVGALIQEHKCIAWTVTTSSSLGEQDPDQMFIYHVPSGKWSEVYLDTEFVFGGASQGYTLEGLSSEFPDLESVPFSLDSSVWQGGSPAFYGFNRSHNLGHFNGSALAAEFCSGDKMLNPGQKTRVKSVRPLVTGTDATVSVALEIRNTQRETPTTLTAVPQDAEGECKMTDQKTTARYHCERVTTTGDFEHAEGVMIEHSPTGWQ